MIRADRLSLNLAIDWLIPKFIERGSLNLLFGDPGSGKSLLALDWAYCTSMGIPWHGFQTQQTDVVIIAGEGFRGITLRLEALCKKYGLQRPTRLWISQQPADLMDGANINWLSETIKNLCPNPGLVIIDTLHRNMNGDENSSQDFACVLQHVDRLLKPLGCAVLIVHHSGHGDKQRSRGSSSIRAAMDAEFSTTKNEERIVLTCHKSKDFEHEPPMDFNLKVVLISESESEPHSAVYLEPLGYSLATKSKKLTLNPKDTQVLRYLEDIFPQKQIKAPDIIRERFGVLFVVSIDDWRNEAFPFISVDSKDDVSKEKAKQKAFNRARERLVKLGHTFEFDDYVWLKNSNDVFDADAKRIIPTIDLIRILADQTLTN